MTGGQGLIQLPVPNNFALVGVVVTLQSVVVDLTTFAGEVSNAIEFEILP
jgi:hypothetical protein